MIFCNFAFLCFFAFFTSYGSYFVFGGHFVFHFLAASSQDLLHAQFQASSSKKWASYAQLCFMAAILFFIRHFVFYSINSCGRSRSTCMQNFVLLASKLSKLCLKLSWYINLEMSYMRRSHCWQGGKTELFNSENFQFRIWSRKYWWNLKILFGFTGFYFLTCFALSIIERMSYNFLPLLIASWQTSSLIQLKISPGWIIHYLSVINVLFSTCKKYMKEKCYGYENFIRCTELRCK